MKKRTQASILREQLSKEGVIISPLVYDAISAKVGEIGYKIVTYPTAPLLSSLYGMMMNMKKLYETGTDWGFVDNMMPFDEFLKFIGKEEYIELERKYLRE